MRHLSTQTHINTQNARALQIPAGKIRGLEPKLEAYQKAGFPMQLIHGGAWGLRSCMLTCIAARTRGRVLLLLPARLLVDAPRRCVAASSHA